MGGRCVKADNTTSPSFLDEAKESFDEDYSIGPLLGKGCYSDVLQAQKGQTLFAVKQIKFSTIRNELYLLKREVMLLKQIDSPFIVHLHGIYQTPEYVYLVMDLCSGGTLKRRLFLEGKQPVGFVKRLAVCILEALKYLHSQNIAHRDIKPENILFTENGDIKLADLGLARFMTGTHNLSVVGTPHYVPPEVIDGVYDCKCDIWSLGVVLFYALTGRLPFDGNGMSEVFFSIKACLIQWDGIEEADKAFLQQMLNKDFKRRVTAQEALNSPWLSGFV